MKGERVLQASTLLAEEAEVKSLASGDTLRIVSVGHVDHGKSTLVGRLLYEAGSLQLEGLSRSRRPANGAGCHLSGHS